MKTTPDKLADWTFGEDEISAGVYRVTAVATEKTGAALEGKYELAVLEVCDDRQVP